MTEITHSAGAFITNGEIILEIEDINIEFEIKTHHIVNIKSKSLKQINDEPKVYENMRLAYQHEIDIYKDILNIELTNPNPF